MTKEKDTDNEKKKVVEKSKSHSLGKEIGKFEPKPMKLMNTSERQQFAGRCVGEYALLEQLIEHSNEPPCPHAKKRRVVTDFPSPCWGAVLVRIGGLMGVQDMRVERERKSWTAEKSRGYYYRSEYFSAVWPHVSTLIAKKARKARASQDSHDITDTELEEVIALSGLKSISQQT